MGRGRAGFGIQDRQDQGTHANRRDRAGWVSSPACLNKGILFLLDQSGNVVENKGGLWKKPDQSANLIENKGSYALKAGMLLKRKVVGRRWGRRTGSGCQVSGRC